jgi:hypothetical protein
MADLYASPSTCAFHKGNALHFKKLKSFKVLDAGGGEWVRQISNFLRN